MIPLVLGWTLPVMNVTIHMKVSAADTTLAGTGYVLLPSEMVLESITILASFESQLTPRNLIPCKKKKN